LGCLIIRRKLGWRTDFFSPQQEAKSSSLMLECGLTRWTGQQPSFPNTGSRVMRKIYIYKLTVDAGAAPCVERGLLSLAICKPIMRKRAKRGDLILGFTANSLDARNRMIYAARISNNLPDGEYYKDSKYKQRSDCIYAYKAERFVRRKDAKYHENARDLVHDLGTYPEYDRANVLLSSDFRYFGASGTDEYKRKFPAVARAIEDLGRGYLVKVSMILQSELCELEKWLWGTTNTKVWGRPTNGPSPRDCHRAKSWAVIC
jgi:hypothetical protein